VVRVTMAPSRARLDAIRISEARRRMTIWESSRSEKRRGATQGTSSRHKGSGQESMLGLQSRVARVNVIAQERS
jgi:hypothetical protein